MIKDYAKYNIFRFTFCSYFNLSSIKFYIFFPSFSMRCFISTRNRDFRLTFVLFIRTARQWESEAHRLFVFSFSFAKGLHSTFICEPVWKQRDLKDQLKQNCLKNTILQVNFALRLSATSREHPQMTSTLFIAASTLIHQ